MSSSKNEPQGSKSVSNHNVETENYPDSQSAIHNDADPDTRQEPLPVPPVLPTLMPNQPKSKSGRNISRPVNESDPLLPNRTTYLDPDDPQVSPLNLKRIRLLRQLLVLIMLFNLALFLVVLVSQFISVPGLGSQEALFLELDWIIICLFTGGVTIWCFAVPSYYERVLGYVSCVLVVLDAIVVLAVPFLRRLFGVFGILLVLWTAANIAFNCFADYWVEKGKAAQEIKYTGRIETRKTVFEMFVTLFKVIVKFLLLLIIWNISLSLWLDAFDSHEKPWGKMIPVNDNQFLVHLACYGDVHYNSTLVGARDEPKQPIVLVEGGQLTSSELFQEWIQELYNMNKIERYCVWDRPGYAFSEGAPSPISIGLVSEYLSEALTKEKIEGPFSAVGFDIGGLYSRVFALRKPGQMHSILLVDSWHEDLLKQFPFSGLNKKNENRHVFDNQLELMTSWQGFLLWVRGLVSPLGIMRSFHWFFHPRKYSSKSRIFGRDMVYSYKYLRSRLQEQITSSILSYNEVRSSDIKNIPLSVILSDGMIKQSLNWGKWQRELTKLSSRPLEWVVAENSNHRIWDSPKGRKQLQQLLLRLVSEKSNY